MKRPCTCKEGLTEFSILVTVLQRSRNNRFSLSLPLSPPIYLSSRDYEESDHGIIQAKKSHDMPSTI